MRTMLCRHLQPRPVRLKHLSLGLNPRLQQTRPLHQTLLRAAQAQRSHQHDEQPSSTTEKVSRALQQLSQHSPAPPVRIPTDHHALLTPSHPSYSILAHPTLVIHRQLEMLNVFAGFEQANRYIILDAQGQHVGYMAEQEHGLGSAVARQAFRTHRSFTAHVFDRDNTEVLRLHRPFAWLSSRLRVYDAISGQARGYDGQRQGHSALTTSSNGRELHTSPLKLADMRVIGESQQQWAPLRRKYNLFLHQPNHRSDKERPQLKAGEIPLSNTVALQTREAKPDGLFAQFAYVDEPWRAWDFALRDADDQPLASVNRNFSGFARELFTDTGVYALRMDGTSQYLEHDTDERRSPDVTGLTLDQRAVMLGTAVSIDFDYFSWHSTATGGFWPMFIPWGGVGGAAEEAGAAGTASGAGTAVESGAGAVTTGSNAAGEVGAIGRESAAVGAGTMAGYEMMQRGVYGNQGDSQSPQTPQTPQGSPTGTGDQAEPGWFDLDLSDGQERRGQWDGDNQQRDQNGGWYPTEGADPRDFDGSRGGSGPGVGRGGGGDTDVDGGIFDDFF